MKALAFLAACTVATPVPVPPRAPATGVPAAWFPPIWQEPALLCVNGYVHGYTPGLGWRCM